MRGFIKPLNLTWDIDEGTLVLGDDIEVKTDDPKKIVKWLTDAGATVHLTDVDAKTVQTFKPPDVYGRQEE